jgi:hypothetical protein
VPVDTLPEPAARRAGGPSRGRASRRWGWPLAVGALLLAALGLRLWGITWGLPFTYNLDERAHFVPKAVGFFSGDLNPNYQLNPSGFSYVIGLAYAVWFRGGDAVRSAYADDPSSAFLVARTVAALMGTASVGLLYLAGARFFDRWTGLLAGALLAVAYLPVFYAHQAINDAPTLAGVALSMVGAALVLRRGRLPDYALAGFGAGLAAGLKYNAGIILLAMVAAAAVHFLDGRRREAVVGVVLGGAASLAGFLLLDPYAILDFATFRDAMQFLVDYNAREPLVGEQRPAACSTTPGPSRGGSAGCRSRLPWAAGSCSASATGARRSWSCPPRSSSSSTWAPRAGTSGATCFPSSRSCACWAPTAACSSCASPAHGDPGCSRPSRRCSRSRRSDKGW